LESIRPASIPQERWEETYAWPLDNKPPYPPRIYQFMRAVAIYVVAVAIIAVLLQELTPFAAVNWLGAMAKKLVTGG
jgi:hypothetical protein